MQKYATSYRWRIYQNEFLYLLAYLKKSTPWRIEEMSGDVRSCLMLNELHFCNHASCLQKLISEFIDVSFDVPIVQVANIEDNY